MGQFLCFFFAESAFLAIYESNFFFKKLFVDIHLWRNLKLKVISFVLFVHWKAICDPIWEKQAERK